MNLRPRRLAIAASRLLLHGLFRLFGGFRVRGLENVPEHGAAILASNHLSWADPPAIRAVIRRSCWFMANHDLFEKPLLAPLIRLYGAFPVRRGTLDRDALRLAEAHLHAGDLLCIFPEGGTTLTGRLYPFEGGVALLAIRNNVPVVPIALTGTDRVLPADLRPRFARGGVTVTFGPPIHPDEIDPSLPRRERVDRLTERLYQAIAAMLPPEYLPEELHGNPPAAPPPDAPALSHR